jgi:hypothetical protein
MSWWYEDDNANDEFEGGNYDDDEEENGVSDFTPLILATWEDEIGKISICHWL